MSDNKKYYYLKLKDNFFDSDEMIVLESMPDGYVYSNILLKLYLRSLKYEGRLMFNERIPFNSTMLAKVTRHSVGDIEKAITIFRDLGLMEILDNGAIYLADIQNFIGTSSTEADRKREYRMRIENEKNNLLKIDGQMSGQKSDKNPPEIELEKEIELELKKETTATAEPEIWKSVVSYQKLWKFPNAFQTEDLAELIQSYSDDLVNEAIRIAGTNDVPKNKSINFLEAVLRNWQNANVNTVEQVNEYEKQYRQDKSQSNYRQSRKNKKEKVPSWMKNKKEIESVASISPERQAELDDMLKDFVKGPG
ncbi:phage replisome organizer N-terminal domain-containing protein [Enterococcus sp. LJL90]